MSSSKMMKVQKIVKAGKAHPFGDTREVTQALGAMGVAKEECDPFLMCDYWNTTEMDDLAKDPDDFPIGWHPHRGFDLATYMKLGIGRHGDSMGNRVTYKSPGIQWISAGSGVYHAEGGANPKGTQMQGFQIWINVPSPQKLEDPRYGTVQPEDLPQVEVSTNSTAWVLAGNLLGVTGPFTTVVHVQMVDLDIRAAEETVSFDIEEEMDTAILFLYEGSLESVNDSINGNNDQNQIENETKATEENIIRKGSVIILDASNISKRTIVMKTPPSTTATSDEEQQSTNVASIMLFAGKKLKQPIAWEGPIVMTDEYEIANTMSEIRGGFFPPICVDWDYKCIASKPSSANVDGANDS